METARMKVLTPDFSVTIEHEEVQLYATGLISTIGRQKARDLA